MSHLNPKKQFTVSFPIETVRKAIYALNETEPNYYKIESDNAALNLIRIHQKGQLLDMGYLIDFSLQKVTETETNVNIEISRNIGTINTASEMSIASNSMKSITDKLGAFLEGKIDEEGKPILPKPTGCVLLLALCFLVIFLTAYMSAYSQKIVKTEIDKSTKFKRIETNNVQFKYQMVPYNTHLIKFRSADSSYFAIFSGHGEGAVVIGSADKIILLLDNDSTVEVMSTGIQDYDFINSTKTFTHQYYISKKQLSELASHDVKSFRKYGARGYIDVEIPKKNQDVIRKTAQVFLAALQ